MGVCFFAQAINEEEVIEEAEFVLELEELSKYPIWYADYERYPQTPYHFEIWQYSDEGTVDGIEGNVDLNIQMIKE